MDVYGDHPLVCICGGERLRRHNHIVERIYPLVKQLCPEISRKENLDPSNLLADGTNKRPADILIPRWTLGKRCAVDVTLIAPMRKEFIPKLLKPDNIGCVAESGAVSKNNKYAKLCADVDIMFVPFSLDATGGFSRSAQDFVHRLCSLTRGNSNTSLGYRKKLLYSQISIAVQSFLVHAISRRSIPLIEQEPIDDIDILQPNWIHE